MEQLQEALKTLLASVYSLSLKAQNYHWNVTGPNFPQYHEFFGEFYGEVGGSIDAIAELLRTTGAFAPASFARFSELSKVQDELMIPETSIMFVRLANDNDTVIGLLYAAHALAEEAGQYGIVNFLEDRIMNHEKHRWMLKSSI